MIDPATIAIEPCNDGPDYVTLQLANQKQLALYPKLAIDDCSGFVSGWIACEGIRPQSNNRRLIGFAERSDSSEYNVPSILSIRAIALDSCILPAVARVPKTTKLNAP